ncbi:MAG: type II toxin-antitoxin system HicA family toxin [Nitrospira sp. SB0677_bin_15]|nr:type II toxin-antitoxin system HicA family toxin [Nitrospira sp. SB0677_bin_15]
MKRKNERTLALIFKHPVSGNIKWTDMMALFRELGAVIEEREGSRISVFIFNRVHVFHRPHPSPNTNKGIVAIIRKFLEENGVRP